MKKRQKLLRILIWVLIAGMVLPLFIGLIKVNSVSKSEVDLLKKKKNELAAQRAAAEKRLDGIRGEMSGLLEQKAILDEKMALNNEELEITEEIIAAVEQEISEKSAEIERLSAEEDELFEKFKLFLRDYYEDGNVSYINVLLTAEDFSDLLVRMDMVKLILDKDQELLDDIKNVREKMQAAKQVLEADKQEAVALKASLEEGRAILEKDLEEAGSLIVQLSGAEAEQLGLVSELEARETAANSQYSAAAKELERLRKEEERRKQEEQQQQQQQQPGQPVAAAGDFTWPTPGYTAITSPFGWRTHPVTGKQNYHSGIDIGAPYGSPIYAAAGGTVIECGYNSIFGYMIRIDHGNGFITLYGHMNAKAKFTVGQAVSKGQQLGNVGSTGMSTGPHLHLTMYKNGTLVNPLNYVKKV